MNCHFLCRQTIFSHKVVTVSELCEMFRVSHGAELSITDWLLIGSVQMSPVVLLLFEVQTRLMSGTLYAAHYH